MSTTMQLEEHNAVAAAKATATVETGVEEMDVGGPSDEPMLSMVEQAEVAWRHSVGRNSRRHALVTQLDTQHAQLTAQLAQLTTQLAQLTTQLQGSRDEAAQRHTELDSQREASKAARAAVEAEAKQQEEAAEAEAKRQEDALAAAKAEAAAS